MKKLSLLKIFLLVFIAIFVASLLSSTKVLAESLPFSITEATITEKSIDSTGTITNFSNNEVISNVIFHKLNDYVIYNISIKSNINKEIKILSITDDNSNEYIAYEYDKYENIKINAKETLEFKVKALYKNELSDITKRNQINNVKFTIKYLENGKVKDGTIVINPKTGDGISKNFILLVISSTGLIVCLILCYIRKNKKLSRISILIITVLVLSPVVVRATSLVFNMTLKNEVGIYDKLVVTYIVDGEVNTLINKYGVPVTQLKTPEKEEFEFTGWTYLDGTDFDSTKPITSDIKIIANFVRKWILPRGKTVDSLSMGDEICLKADRTQCFNFIGYDGDNINMLSKWNLKVGKINDDKDIKIGEYTSSTPGYGLQSSEARGIVNGESSYNGVVSFTNKVYWHESGNLKPKYGSSYPADVYDTDYNSASGTNYSVAYYVEQYKHLLTEYGATIESARLLTYNDLDSTIGCEVNSYNCSKISFITNTSFWLGSAFGQNYIWRIHAGGKLDRSYFNYGEHYGVRPVVTISKSEI